MGNAITGIDVSSWQHQDNEPIDWWRVQADGYQFAVIKATQGTQYVNPWVVRDISDANAAGLLVGAYHYYEAGEDPQAQAKWFTSNLIMQQLDLGCFVDWECYSAEPYTHSQELVNFLTEARLSRLQCGIYCEEAWALQIKKENINHGRLWVARTDDEPTVPCFMWQSLVTQAVDGVNGKCDVNVVDNTRGLDIPTAPMTQPPAERLYSLKEAEDAEAQAVEDDEETEDDGDQ